MKYIDKYAQTKTLKEKVMPLLNVERQAHILNETAETDYSRNR